MGGMFRPKMPAPPPQVARPVTAVQKTPDLEMADEETPAMGIKKKQKGKKQLKVTTDTSLQTGSTGSGLQIGQGS
ncbi:hypothetical protein OAA57_00730 [bacterium]|jgi:hypothetical protein|nr:hypothetical protein [bacterium]MDB4350086.1 hypothetical protein [bacterium]|tara:strand:- start:319 stop:543 length:225 start_codon:yes stop_codon:yes gene_type:complete